MKNGGLDVRGPKPMLTDLRIQLEGRVEKVEQAVWAWESAAKLLRSNGWRSGTLFELLAQVTPQIDEAVEVVLNKAPDAPELVALAARLDRAQEQARTGAVERLRRLGISLASDGLDAVLAELRLHHPILYEERIGWSAPHMAAWLGGAVLFTIGLWIAGASWVPGLFPVLLVLAVAHRWRSSTMVVLTQRTLVIGERAAQLSDLLSASGTASRGRSRFTLIFRDQPAWTVQTTGSPDVLFRRLRLLGVTCELKQSAFFH